VILLGHTHEELGGSEWQQMFVRNAMAAPPRVDLEREKTLVELLLSLHATHTLRSAHDLANGGLAVALAEMSMDGIGCHVDLGTHADDLDATALLFSESPRRCEPRRPRPRPRRRNDRRYSPPNPSATPPTAPSSSSATASPSSAWPPRNSPESGGRRSPHYWPVIR
jgi:hypothetical protein